MVAAEEFMKYCTQTLEVYFGQMAHEIVNKVNAKKPLTASSTPADLKEFIDRIETNISVFSGKHRATDICVILRNKATEMTGTIKATESAISSSIDNEVQTFLNDNTLPSEADITDYAKYLAMKYGGSAATVEKDLIDKVKVHVKKAISNKMLKAEIYKFLVSFPSPAKQDVDDFVHYLSLLKLNLSENEVRDMVETERLYRKFHGPEETVETSEIDDFINLVKASTDKTAIGKMMQSQGLSYLIKDDKGVSDKVLTEFVDLMTPKESDMKEALENMGLKHMIKNK